MRMNFYLRISIEISNKFYICWIIFRDSFLSLIVNVFDIFHIFNYLEYGENMGSVYNGTYLRIYGVSFHSADLSSKAKTLGAIERELIQNADTYKKTSGKFSKIVILRGMPLSIFQNARPFAAKYLQCLSRLICDNNSLLPYDVRHAQKHKY